jgi:hypothetical protein
MRISAFFHDVQRDYVSSFGAFPFFSALDQMRRSNLSWASSSSWLASCNMREMMRAKRSGSFTPMPYIVLSSFTWRCLAVSGATVFLTVFLVVLGAVWPLRMGAWSLPGSVNVRRCLSGRNRRSVHPLLFDFLPLGCSSWRKYHSLMVDNCQWADVCHWQQI